VFELGVDGLIAPMIESPFALEKFLNACKFIYGEQKIFKSMGYSLGCSPFFYFNGLFAPVLTPYSSSLYLYPPTNIK
tara:strand:+ start:7024 stop:7254 length:231 start_codon:yes stop_codon:yes gene_type:complete